MNLNLLLWKRVFVDVNKLGILRHHPGLGNPKSNGVLIREGKRRNTERIRSYKERGRDRGYDSTSLRLPGAMGSWTRGKEWNLP